MVTKTCYVMSEMNGHERPKKQWGKCTTRYLDEGYRFSENYNIESTLTTESLIVTSRYAASQPGSVISPFDAAVSANFALSSLKVCCVRP